MIGCLSFALAAAALVATYGTGLFVPAIVVAVATFWSIGVIQNYRDDPRSAPNWAAMVSMGAFVASVILIVGGLVIRVGGGEDNDGYDSDRYDSDGYGREGYGEPEAEPLPEPQPPLQVESEADDGYRRSGQVSWDAAADHLGETKMVCGPVRSIREDSGDTFINVGRDYPDPDRFTIVIWNQTGLTADDPTGEVCIEGKIADYRGTAQITTEDYEDLKAPQ